MHKTLLPASCTEKSIGSHCFGNSRLQETSFLTTCKVRGNPSAEHPQKKRKSILESYTRSGKKHDSLRKSHGKFEHQRLRAHKLVSKKSGTVIKHPAKFKSWRVFLPARRDVWRQIRRV